MLTTVPVAIAVLGVKLLLEYVLDLKGFVEFGEIGIVLTAGVFLTGFMLGGTLADYKESEKLPGEIACQLEAIEDQCVQGAQTKNLPVQPLLGAVLTLTDAVRDWMYKRKPQVEMYGALNAFG